MTGRERLLATLRRQPVDRVPISTYELTSFGYYGWPRLEPSYHDLLAEITERTDALPLWSAGVSNPLSDLMSYESWQDGDYNCTRTTIHTPQGPLTQVSKEMPSVKTTWVTEHFCKSHDDILRYLSLPVALGTVDTSEFNILNTEVGEHGLVLCDTGDAIGHVAGLFEFGEFTIQVYTEPALIHTLCDRAHATIMHTLRAMLEAGCGPCYRIWGPEYCTAPFLPASAFKEFVLPYVSEMVALIHQYDCYARLHCHGRIRDVLDMIIATGADAIDPIEPLSDGDISLGEVKARYDDKLVLFGNMELKYLERETPADIERRVRTMMDEARAGGGYVLMPTAAPINIPLSKQTAENYHAFIDAGHRYGQY